MATGKFRPQHRQEAGPSNEERAESANQLVSGYSGGENDFESDVTDLLSDLMHLCDREAGTLYHGSANFDQYLEMARTHHEEEK